MAIYDFFVSRNNSANVATYVGHVGRLFYDDTNGLIRIANGQPGGNIVQNPALAASSITPPAAPFEGMLWFNPTTEELWAYHAGAFQGTINPATTTKLGGIIAGPGANVATDGTLTIDTTGLPLGIGNVSIVDTTITTVNPDADLILSSNGTGNVELVGNVRFYSISEGHTGNPYFMAVNDGQVTFYTPITNPTRGAVRIVGSNTGNVALPINSGVMLHVTGNNNDASRIYNDGIGSFGAYVSRRMNGNVSFPTQVLAGEDIMRISAVGYATGGMPQFGSSRIVFRALENFTQTAQGGQLLFYTVPIGGNVLTQVASVDNQSGLITTKATVQGNLIVNGSIIGNAVATTATLGSATITGLVTARNFSGQVRDVGTLGSGATLTIDYSTDHMVLVNVSGPLTIAHANISLGKMVSVVIKNTTGVNQPITTGVTAVNTSNGNDTPNVNNNRSGVFVYRSFGATTANVYCEFN